MRFITEFELTSDELKYAENPIKGHRKSCAEERLGRIIAESFGWEEKGVTTLHGPVKERHTIEIEAFPMDKWESFKRNLLYYTERCEYKHLIQLLFEELESFGKPAGDTITNQK